MKAYFSIPGTLLHNFLISPGFDSLNLLIYKEKKGNRIETKQTKYNETITREI